MTTTDEIPDWYIYDKNQNKLLIGMNQLDLWKGGAQSNRGTKYISNRYTTPHSKLLCIVCNKIKINSNKSKVYRLFNCGFNNNTLCYVNNLENIIRVYFMWK